MLVRKRPHPTQKAVAAFYRRIIPLKCGLRRRSEHRIEARRISAVFFNQVLRVDAVVLGLRHRAHTFVINRRANWQLPVRTSGFIF